MSPFGNISPSLVSYYKQLSVSSLPSLLPSTKVFPIPPDCESNVHYQYYLKCVDEDSNEDFTGTGTALLLLLL
jgi:hypothetical protein